MVVGVVVVVVVIGVIVVDCMRTIIITTEWLVNKFALWDLW